MLNYTKKMTELFSTEVIESTVFSLFPAMKYHELLG